MFKSRQVYFLPLPLQPYWCKCLPSFLWGYCSRLLIVITLFFFLVYFQHSSERGILKGNSDHAPFLHKILQCLSVSFKMPMVIYKIRLSLTINFYLTIFYLFTQANHIGTTCHFFNMPRTILPCDLCHFCSLWLHTLPLSIHMWFTPSLTSGFYSKPHQWGLLWTPTIPHSHLFSTSFDFFPDCFCCCCCPFHLLWSMNYISFIYFV